MPTIHDEEFGNITVRRNIKSSQVRIRVTAGGALSASLPRYAPLFLVKRLIKNSRDELRKILEQAKPKQKFVNGMQIGKSHILKIQQTNYPTFCVSRTKNQILIETPSLDKLLTSANDRKIREVIAQALKLEAKSYLPKRVVFYAQKCGFKYNKVRFSHASSRWGSYSSTGTVSLNIALMKLPFELIDYVIIHELAHTREMNHSRKFWAIVHSIDPDFQKHRRELKTNNPSI